jgi:site-specific DNA recombinase
MRVSTQKQTQSQTIEQQMQQLKTWIDSKGLQVLEQNIFRDDGYSGTTLNRPGLSRLRDQIMMGTNDGNTRPSLNNFA